MRVQTLRHAALAGFALLVAATAISPAFAQTTYGSIVGTARDASGAVVAGGQVTVTNQATRVKVAQSTNELGAYAFTTPFPGSYPVHAEFNGFRPPGVNG